MSQSTNVTVLKPHISLNVTDIEKSVEFYKKLFGAEPVKFIRGKSTVHSIVREKNGESAENERFGYAKFDLTSPALNLVLNEVPFTPGGSLSHLGIQVASTDDVLSVRSQWEKAGILTVDEMQVDCCYALQDKTWARDPDGNEWEVFVVLANTSPETTSCGCGTKIEPKPLQTEQCCTGEPNAVTISATQNSCC
jgi:catechol 2,3-dioxygenase-like lactoylglutathione lyase family enzyme